jgi:hypothetical protein
MAMMRLRREDPRVVGSFKLHRRLGAGGMGVVYLGSDRRGQRVALKVIRPDLAEDKEFRSRFAREVSAARRIRGGCTARLVAADLEADRPWFATQYVPGPSLQDKVTESGPLPASQVASIGAALAEGLVAVHEAGVVHRDLKPSNILLSPKGPRIIDFGIAWATGASTLTHVGTAVGSPGFLAPEQVRGAVVTPATDVFALGATLAYAATADSPFGQGSSEVMLYRVVHEQPQLHDVHAALAPLIEVCLGKSPEDRPSTLQLSLRLKEIAAREARGLSEGTGTGHTGHTTGSDTATGTATGTGDGGAGMGGTDTGAGGAGASGAGASGARTGRSAGTTGVRRTGSGPVRTRRSEGRPPQRTERHSPARPRERSGSGRRGGGGGVRTGSGSGGGGSASGAGSGSASGGRKSTGGTAGASSANGRTSGRTGGDRPTPGRSGPRKQPGPNARRPGPNPRLLRQRLIVFVTVTLLVALGIAAAQGCQGPTDGLGSPGHRTGHHHTALP